MRISVPLEWSPKAEIRTTLKAYLDSGAKLEFGETLVFAAGDLALMHTGWALLSHA